jgi:hypothetical protein
VAARRPAVDRVRDQLLTSRPRGEDNGLAGNSPAAVVQVGQHGAVPLSFDPRASAESLAGRRLTRGSRSHAEKPESYFCGTWDGRHPLNVPGPFYGAQTDTCCDGPPLAPSSLLYDHDGQGFVWRQPRTEEETHELMTGASSDPFSGYAWDGDQHWTPDLVRSWWAERHAHTPLIDLIVARVAGPRPELRSDYEDLLFRCLPIGGYSEDERRLLAGIVHKFVEYRLSGMERDLRRYLHFLETGGYPDADATLPTL